MLTLNLHQNNDLGNLRKHGYSNRKSQAKRHSSYYCIKRQVELRTEFQQTSPIVIRRSRLYTCTHIRVCVSVSCTRIQEHAYTHAHMYTCMHTRTRTYPYALGRLMHTHTHTHTHTDTHTYAHMLRLKYLNQIPLSTHITHHIDFITMMDVEKLLKSTHFKL